MRSAICTLFESHYHYGLAVLVNSLCQQGYSGPVYAGYRGNLPFWASSARNNLSLGWKGAVTLSVTQDIEIHFIPLTTDYHLTNYKPDFLLEVWDGPAREAASMYYFDPDITVCEKWNLFEHWTECGIALCEDINSPMAAYHPRRVAWRSYFSKENIRLTFKEATYANGGFVGVSRDNKAFLELWKQIQEKMGPAIGGLSRSSLTGPALPEEATSYFAPFPKTDQDALNAAIEAWEGQVSFVGKEGMGFCHGAIMMAHAIGSPKPWEKNFILNALKGFKLSVADRNFWQYTGRPISTHSPVTIKVKNMSLIASLFLNRFYVKS